jgi:tetrahydromethanopterin S-methyltransferase subunit F
VLIDCDSCTVRGLACGDCVVTVLLGVPPAGVELDDAEQAAIGVLAAQGLVPPLRLLTGLVGQVGQQGRVGQVGQGRSAAS